ncbi:MAG: ATP-dependent DNA helicase PcrA, DNA helicase II / ATP-dependent DNA helicase PcrA [Microgenomates group bacterium GW2011_GWC1_41_20]|nr:MAG: ATP-dependent DNA helicase pcrA [Candidatus Woesebacteria bacterium GW2011_GWB1_40_12]KKR56268.1 MAG: ATP-dependent DNA helicase pcrA [Candidatus Woesebacteria bacterium GW2011_GWF1_40_24]KKR91072.1 MAG: ATP-dependent DNA helicase pcrA [Candidatus Woesebacteria bacterium GW2011_GWD1_41_12]KKS00698.1 MAG: ATP-dependent DNA helicase PcrA, DNA helicase II / ATP-dependent DNA helicase PcrA [Microgenomates group bacterium GW2011_GWC1_41_20]KKS05336.1 MAG: ATP-dependent DNA helicase pcrA [Can
MVLAGAGSGKTKVLTHRVAYFISKGLIKPENALLLTFTNKAANEMKERIFKLTEGNSPTTGTFHSFCAKILRIDGEHIGIPKNFIIYDDSDQKEEVKEIMERLNISTDQYNPASILNGIGEAKNQMLSPAEYINFVRGEWQEVAAKVYIEYERALKEIGALDFDDLLIKTVTLFKEIPEVLQKWQNRLTHIFVDEWQDTNKIQYALTKLLVGKGNNITAVGDASQSIYSWRGADYRNINNLTRDYPNVKVVNLEQNYRSTQNILDAANLVISKNTGHPILKLWTEKEKGSRIKLYTARNGFDEADFVVSTINELMLNSVKYSDIAILYRTNAQSRVLEEAFLHAGIPYVLVGGVKFYDRKEIKDVLGFIRYIVNSKDTVSKKRIEKIGKRRFEKLENFRTENPDLEGLTTLDILDVVIQKTDYLALFQKETEENLTRLENLKELRSVATEFPDINEFLENVALVEASQDSNKRVIPNSQLKDCVTLMTLHAAKGLEFPIVFIVGMEEGLFPHSRSLMDSGQMEEERRLAYVGITRAKDQLFLTYANSRLYFGERISNPPSRFITDIPENLLEGVGENINPVDNFKLDSVDDIKGTFDDIIEKYLGHENE